MPGIAAWKLIIPVSGAAVVGLLMVRPENFNSFEPTPQSRAAPATLGYLTPAEMPDGVALLPPPPQAGSAAMTRDEEARAAAQGLRGTPRYALAVADANREQANTIAAFQCAFGTEISAQETPALNRLLAKLRLDVRAATYPPKMHFERERPFVMYKVHSCYPPDDQNVRNDGSYPSARGAVGWAYALVLAEINPARADDILQRGREFGQSRVVCDQEWLSDVDAARTIAEAAMRHIREKPAFRNDFDAAQKEALAAIKSKVAPPNCQSETRALKAGTTQLAEAAPSR